MTSVRTDQLAVDTPVGAGHIVLDLAVGTPGGPHPLVVLGHGAGGGPDAADLVALRDALLAAGCSVARTVQPYRVAGRRAPAPVAQLDASFTAMVGAARARAFGPLVVGGRSNGARVACRTADSLGALAVVALSFPLHPPARPDVTRAPELTAVAVPALVLQGERDPFGTPGDLRAAAPGCEVVDLPGANHSPRAGAALREAAAIVARWVLVQTRD